MGKKRANGEGNIRKRKDGRWEGRYTAGHDPETGKAIYKNVLGRTQAEAKTKLKAAIEEPDLPGLHRQPHQAQHREAAAGKTHFSGVTKAL